MFCLGPYEEDSGDNYRLHRLERTSFDSSVLCLPTPVMWSSSGRKISIETNMNPDGDSACGWKTREVSDKCFWCAAEGTNTRTVFGNYSKCQEGERDEKFKETKVFFNINAYLFPIKSVMKGCQWIMIVFALHWGNRRHCHNYMQISFFF